MLRTIRALLLALLVPGLPAFAQDDREFTEEARKKYAAELREATALAPEFLFCNLERVPATADRLWPGPWEWAIYEVRDLETARHCRDLGAKYVETMAVRSLRTAYDEAASGA